MLLSNLLPVESHARARVMTDPASSGSADRLDFFWSHEPTVFYAFASFPSPVYRLSLVDGVVAYKPEIHRFFRSILQALLRRAATQMGQSIAVVPTDET